MKLPRPFYKLPVTVDAARLQAEALSLPDAAWVAHPTGYRGNSHVRLISVGGTENDDVLGVMHATPHLLACPYVQQVLESFNVVWSRSRLMRLAPGATVPEHADISYHWFNRVRIHIPLITNPDVSFYCGEEVVQMAAGEVWMFDNWRRHRVENASATQRIHLVADTTGSSAFWQGVLSDAERIMPRRVSFDSGRQAQVLMERSAPHRIMHPSEVELLLSDLADEVTADSSAQSADRCVLEVKALLGAFVKDWRQLWTLFADTQEGLAHYEKLRDSLRLRLRVAEDVTFMRTNAISVRRVVEARVLQHAIASDIASITAVAPERGTEAKVPAASAEVLSMSRAALRRIGRGLQRPVMIVAAPRSGSTLLFETLSVTPQFWTLGGEAHWLIESLPALCPGGMVDSNRLEGGHCTDEVRMHVLSLIQRRLHDSKGRKWDGFEPVRFLEKTPKNALRIPFFERVFEDTHYIFLWRDPAQNISSMIEAWRDGRWTTYPNLQGWDGPWSLLLPQGWQQLRGKTLAEIATYQWKVTNETIMRDLARVPAARRHVVRYEDLIENPRATIQRLSDFSGVHMDEQLTAAVSAPLPLSRYTLTSPAREKWKANAEVVTPLLPMLDATLLALRGFA